MNSWIPGDLSLLLYKTSVSKASGTSTFDKPSGVDDGDDGGMKRAKSLESVDFWSHGTGLRYDKDWVGGRAFVSMEAKTLWWPYGIPSWRNSLQIICLRRLSLALHFHSDRCAGKGRTRKDLHIPRISPITDTTFA